MLTQELEKAGFMYPSDCTAIYRVQQIYRNRIMTMICTEQTGFSCTKIILSRNGIVAEDKKTFLGVFATVEEAVQAAK